jgi:tetratricopeptide (TPR) repeat protein
MTNIDHNPGIPSSRGQRGRARLWVAFCLIAFVALGSGCASGPTDEELGKKLRIAVARRNLGVDHLASGRTPLAIRELQYSYSLNPDDPVTVQWLGEAYRRRGLLDKALDMLLESAAEDPADHDLNLNLAGIYVQLKRYPEAIHHSQILIDDPTFAAPWAALTNRGWAEFQMGLKQKARASFEEALEFRSKYWPARLNLGILENSEGHRLRAITNFEQVLERDLGRGAESEANYRLGEVYVTLGRRSKAVDHFKRSVARAPEGRWGKQSEEYLKLLY